MAMFLVHMQLTLPPEMPQDTVSEYYAAEAKSAQPYLQSGQFARVWREPGTRNHWAEWDVEDVQVIHDAYTNFPMFPWMEVQVIPLCTNPNDPGTPYAGCDGLMFTWRDLNRYYLQNATGGLSHQSAAQAARHEGASVILDDSDPDAVISIHRHPGSPFPEEFHLMVGDTKVAELGPDENAHGEPKAPGYVDILAEWDGAPVTWQKVKARVLADNKVLHPDYETALRGPRARF